MNESNRRSEQTTPDTARPSPQAIKTFITAVGRRIRETRLRRGISRRVTSEMSGVSQRYLAQLERGDGNVSIALLYKVAHALGHGVEWFVTENGDLDPEAVEMARRFTSADVEQRRRIAEILDTMPDRNRKRRICLIGVRGAGKSTLGRMVGEALSVPFAELNSDIEDLSGMPVDEVIALYGQEGFRELERRALERIVSTTDQVIVAVAGGIVSEPAAYAYLLRNFHTIWLKASPEEHMERVRAQGDYRPMAGNPKAMEELQNILTSRETLYAKADSTVDTSGKSVRDSLHELIRVIQEMDTLANPV